MAAANRNGAIMERLVHQKLKGRGFDYQVAIVNERCM